MKNRIISLILALTLIASVIPAIVVSAEDAATPTLEIVSKNLSYESNIRLLFAVKSANVGDAEIKLNVYEEDPVANADAAIKETVPVAYTESIGSYGECNVFFTTGIAAKFLQKQLYVQAVVTVDGTTYKSEVERYSIVEYCHEMIAKDSTDAAKDAKYMNVIEYGAAIQSFLADDTNADGTPKYSGAYATDYKYVTIKGGTLDGRYDTGIYLAGEKVKPYAEGVENWETNDGALAANGAEYTIGDKNVSFARPVVKVDFEGLNALPSTITALEKGDPTIPVVRNQSTNPKDRLAPSVGKFSVFSKYNDTNGLYFMYINDSKSAVLKFAETDAAYSGANALEFEADIVLACAAATTSGLEFMNLVFANAEGDVAYNLIFRTGTTIASGSPVRLDFNTRVANGASHGFTEGVVNSSDRSIPLTFKLRVLYTNTADSVAIKVYINGNIVATHTQEYGINNGGNWESSIIDALDITNAYLFINTNATTSNNVAMNLMLDNVKFNKIVAD